MKIKIGMYAPIKEVLLKTGTDDLVENSDLNKKEGKLISFKANRVGSSTEGNGAPGRT